MSKILAPLVIALALGAIGFGAWRSHQLGEEQRRAQSLERLVKEITDKADKLEKEAARLRELNGVFQGESEQLRAKLAGLARGEKVEGTPPGAIVPEGQAAGKNAPKGFASAMSKMFTDPAMKKAMRSQQQMGMRMMYGDLAKELGLTPDEADQILELVTDRQIAQSAEAMKMMGDAQGDEGQLAKIGESMNQSRKEFDDQIKGAIGDERFAKFQKYESSLGERIALNTLQQNFSARGMTLEDTQKQSLLDIMVEERQKAPANPLDPGRRDVAGQMKAMTSDESMKNLLDQQKQVNARVLDRARSILTPDQINAFRDSQQQFLQMQEFGMKMGREMMKQQ